ncbi:caspase family protein [Nostoc sp. CHAB 5836]|uniref:caspase family protein n=1 Tax=Nostoc sp. CHAB 5836 TaxID=2780404 RepID=UPI001E4058A7|nr:caspase family protein [Nostoc sp. CHAB 5836]MCC5618018.1 caspase family protein [Nostoc sp. CHAB 5836]
MMKRRNFLQLTGSTLAALGMSHLDIINQGNRYAKVLAENTPRKLALLVGINKYPKNRQFSNELKGCVNDVHMQKELLIHRFGFCPDDIITLDSEQTRDELLPTRKNILHKFEEHLIKQTKPGHIVVFHFSGHGIILQDPKPIKDCNPNFLEYNSALAVMDDIDDIKDKYVLDIMGRTLFLLRLALLKQDVTKVTMLLDSCFSGGGTRGNFVERSLPGNGSEPHPEEIAYQKSWMDKLGIKDENAFKELRCRNNGNGIVIASSEKGTQSYDGQIIPQLDAGAFTYFLTQYLWQETNTVGKIITEIKNPLSLLSKQKPVVDGDKTQPIFFIDTKSIPPSEGVISKIKGEEITLWLGGVETQSLANMQKNAKFAIFNNHGEVLGEVALTSPPNLLDTKKTNILEAKAKLLSSLATLNLQPGMFIKEISRIIPANLQLNIGLDPSLTKDIGDARKNISQINRIEAIPAQANTLYSKKVEYILGRMTEENRKKQTNREDLPDIDTIGLFSEALEFIPGSFGKPGESITDAISRLKPKLTSFLAIHILKQTLNPNSSKLDVEASISLLEQPNTIITKTQTSRVKSNQTQPNETYSRVLPLNKLFQFEIKNNTDDNLYVMVILIDVTGKPYVVYPYQNRIKNETLQIKPGEPLIVGKLGQIELKAVEKGIAEALIVTSRSELKNAAKMLQQLVRETRGGGRGEANQPIDISRGEPVAVIDDLLDDLSGSRGGSSQPREVKAENIATLSMSFLVG